MGLADGLVMRMYPSPLSFYISKDSYEKLRKSGQIGYLLNKLGKSVGLGACGSVIAHRGTDAKGNKLGDCHEVERRQKRTKPPSTPHKRGHLTTSD